MTMRQKQFRRNIGQEVGQELMERAGAQARRGTGKRAAPRRGSKPASQAAAWLAVLVLLAAGTSVGADEAEKADKAAKPSSTAEPSSTAKPPETAALDAQLVKDCMKANEPETTSVQRIQLEAHDRSGGVTYSKARVYWERQEDGLSKVMARIFEPPDMHGAGLLLVEEEGHTPMYMYLPDVGRVQRVNKHMAQGSLFGTDFTYEEFQHIYGMVEEQDSTRLPDEEIEGRPVYVMDGTPAEDSSYTRTRISVDQETCVPLRMEFYERGDRLRKVIVTDAESIIDVDGRRFAGRLEGRDIRDNTKSLLIVEKIDLGVNIPRRTFSTNWLEVGRR
jgi:hypothetical protein